MRNKRQFVGGAFYHVTSRTNDKIRVFENNLGRKIMLMTLQDAKDKFHFNLTNFCVMPTHIHLLIKPEEKTCLSEIMRWIKTVSAKRWNNIHGSTDHLWGNRYFARAIKDNDEYETVMNYIEQNPVVAGLTASPEDWKASAAFYKARGIYDLVDLSHESTQEILYLPLIPFVLSKIIPPAQLEHILHYIGAYTVALDRIYNILPKIPNINDIVATPKPSVYLHYHSKTNNYFICGFDGENKMYGKVQSNIFPDETQYREINLSELMKNPLLRLDLSKEYPY
jgi:putative transposase